MGEMNSPIFFRRKMMKKSLLVLFLILVMSLASVGTVQAITGGVKDGNAHPYVGLLIFTDGTDYWSCSGSLIAPQVVLTAGHCTDGAIQTWVTFDTHVERGTLSLVNWLASDPFITGTAHTEPDFCLGCGKGAIRFDSHDVGIVTLDDPADVGQYAVLPEEGYADTLPMNTSIDLVGYGVQTRVVGGGQPYWAGTFDRYFAPANLIASEDRLSGEYIKLSANPGKGKGGTCFGDSGGPDLKGGTNIVLAVNSFVNNGNCTGVTYSNRIDLSYALEFINSFMP
jgi:hypothetical protein